MDSAACFVDAAWPVATVGLAWLLAWAWRGEMPAKRRQLERQLLESNARLRLQKIVLEREKAEAGQQKHQVESAHRQIALLSDIGRQITASLDHASIMRTIYRWVLTLMDADVFMVGLCPPGRDVVEFPFVMKDRLAAPAYASGGAAASAIRCVRQATEVVIGDQGQAPGARTARCVLCVPMLVNGRVLGVIALHSYRPHAYDAVQIDMIRTLGAYTAVALDNADACLRLEQALGALKHTQQQMVFREKMAALGTLTAGVAHEINNPTNFAHAGAQGMQTELAGFEQFLLALAGDDADPAVVASIRKRIAELARQLGTILEGTSRIRDLVRDLRTFSRLDEGERKSVHIADSLASTVNLVRTQYAPVCDIDCVLDANPLLECWPAQLNQVFMNLIINGCHAIESRLRAGGPALPGLLRIVSLRDGDELALSFSDNGCGMPAAIAARVFEPFFTTKGEGDGTGLGLSISFGIIERHGGTISVVSTEGDGSCFTVRLPIRPVATPLRQDNADLVICNTSVIGAVGSR